MQRHWWMAALLTLGVALGSVAVACSGRDGGSGADANGTVVSIPKSTGGTKGGPDTVVAGPASRYSPATNQLPGDFSVDIPDTFTQNISTFSSSYWFTTAQQGNQLAQQWKIIDGYKVDFNPNGLGAAVLQGSYYASVEVYLFQDTIGASQAYTYIQQKLAKTAGSEVINANQLGNESSAFQIISGTVASSTTPAIYHRFLWRRGNIVASVQTTGAKGHMTIDAARNIAVIMDDRILGKTAATEPTPLPTPAFNFPPTAVPSASTRAGS